jgi:hypothetical protein
MSDERREARLDALSERIARWHLIVIATLVVGSIILWLLMAP